MASPYEMGSISGMAFIDNQIDIKKEILELNISSDLNTGKYKVQYFIYTDKAVDHLPLIFYAMDYKEGFSVLVDNKPISISAIPFGEIENLKSSVHTLLDTVFSENYYIEIDGNTIHYTDLRYFETRLDSGSHIITVEYISYAGLDRSNWVKDYEYRYSLYPARFWKSFGQLEFIVKADFSKIDFKDNLGNPLVSNDSLRTYQFFKLPVNTIQIYAHPRISKLARFLIWIHPLGIAAIGFVIMTIMLVFMIKSFHKNNPNKKARWLVGIGSLLIPLISFFLFGISFPLIDDIIGPSASQYHGYFFLIIFFYPFILLVYWPAMALISSYYKKAKQTNEGYQK